MNAEDLDAWRANAVTKQVFQYMRDYANEIAKIQATTDHGDKPSDEVARIQAQTYGMCSVIEDLIGIDAEMVNNFYEKEEENEEVQ